MSEATELITRYLDLVGAHDLAPLEDLFDEDLVATTIGSTFDRAEWISALARLLPILERNEIRQTFEGASLPVHRGGDGRAAAFYDFVTNTPAGAVPCAEWITVRAGRITTVELIVDKTNWAQVVAALQAG